VPTSTNTPTSTPTPIEDFAEEEVDGEEGATVSTGDEATPGDTTVTNIVIPAGATDQTFTLTITEEPADDPAGGFSAFGQQINIDAEGVTLDEPATITFTFDSSVTGGIDPEDVVIFKNGVQVGDCIDAGLPNPDPCVIDVTEVGGDIVVRVSTTSFSLWVAATQDVVEPTPTNTVPPTPPSPPTQECLTLGEKIGLAIGIFLRFGAEEGERRYRVTYDVNDDGVINFDDLAEVLLAPTCKKDKRR
jgi:hypothetical protein